MGQIIRVEITVSPSSRKAMLKNCSLVADEINVPIIKNGRPIVLFEIAEYVNYFYVYYNVDYFESSLYFTHRLALLVGSIWILDVEESNKQAFNFRVFRLANLKTGNRK